MNWELIVYIVSGISAFVIVILVLFLVRQCCTRCCMWNVRTNRKRDKQTTDETYILNPQPLPHCPRESTV